MDLEILAEGLRRLTDDERRCLSDIMYPIDLKLTGVPEVEPDPDTFVPKRNIREIALHLIETIQFTLRNLKQEELRELNGLIASDGLKFLKIVHTVDYMEP